MIITGQMNRPQLVPMLSCIFHQMRGLKRRVQILIVSIARVSSRAFHFVGEAKETDHVHEPEPRGLELEHVLAGVVILEDVRRFVGEHVEHAMSASVNGVGEL
jgi:hypothetical protein